MTFLEEYGLIIGCIFIVLILIPLIGCSIYWIKSKKDEDLAEPKTLIADTKSIKVNTMTSDSTQSKPNLAKERTFGKLKPTLKRIRTVEFDHHKK